MFKYLIVISSLALYHYLICQLSYLFNFQWLCFLIRNGICSFAPLSNLWFHNVWSFYIVIFTSLNMQQLRYHNWKFLYLKFLCIWLYHFCFLLFTVVVNAYKTCLKKIVFTHGYFVSSNRILFCRQIYFYFWWRTVEHWVWK